MIDIHTAMKKEIHTGMVAFHTGMEFHFFCYRGRAIGGKGEHGAPHSTVVWKHVPYDGDRFHLHASRCGPSGIRLGVSRGVASE